eukprot:TRINITY_DN21885_c0_g7_i1.p1 TRINITY_DN21885_c0_g7~~TRINITY_DN21885_c0_g7_i1.p1  ORF type:complete len:307 (+),score=52.37 TRINITY_DN21885_c0_g7_i1:77-997(+)
MYFGDIGLFGSFADASHPAKRRPQADDILDAADDFLVDQTPETFNQGSLVTAHFMKEVYSVVPTDNSGIPLAARLFAHTIIYVCEGRKTDDTWLDVLAAFRALYTNETMEVLHRRYRSSVCKPPGSNDLSRSRLTRYSYPCLHGRITGGKVEEIIDDINANYNPGRAIARLRKRCRRSEVKVDALEQKVEQHDMLLRAYFTIDSTGGPSVPAADPSPGEGSWGSAYLAATDEERLAMRWALKVGVLRPQEFSGADIVPPQHVASCMALAHRLWANGGSEWSDELAMRVFQDEYAKLHVAQYSVPAP